MPVAKGVPQGSPLSPLLFNIAVRLLPNCCNSDLFQYADDLTNSTSDSDLNVLVSKLQISYGKIKVFCEDKKLTINTAKTQVIILKSPRKKLPVDFSVSLEGLPIFPSTTIKLLGVVLDQHSTMGPHIDATIKKCHGLLGMLRRASTYLPRDILRLIYVALIRSQLEYASATFANAASSHLNKLDIVQKIASRIITGSPALTHSAPLQLQLGLHSLQSRRISHVASIVENILNGKTHPFFTDFFSDSPPYRSRTETGKSLQSKGFSNYGILFHKDYRNSLGAPSRLIHPLTNGQSTELIESQSVSPVINSAQTFSVPLQVCSLYEDG